MPDSVVSRKTPAESPGLINSGLSVIFSSQNGIFHLKVDKSAHNSKKHHWDLEMLCFPFHYRKKMSAQGSEDLVKCLLFH